MNPRILFLLQHPLVYVVYATLLAGGIFYTALQSDFLFVTPDSGYYLDEATRLSQAGVISGTLNSGFTFWPIGYPLLIAVVMNVFYVSALTASKLVNVFFLLGIFALLRLMFKQQAILYALLFSHALVIILFRYTWSEPGFIFFELLAFFAAQQLVTFHTGKAMFLLFLSCAGLLMMRYSGIFIFPWLLWIIIQQWRYNKLVVMKLSVVLCLLLCLEVAYGLRNLTLSGLWFGFNRGEDTNGLGLNMFFLARAMTQQLSFILHAKTIQVWLVAVLIQTTLIGLVWKMVQVKSELSVRLLHSNIWLSGSILSLAVVAGLRFFIHFDDFNYRLLLPGLLPAVVYVLNQLTTQYPLFYARALLVLTAFALLSMGCNFYPYFN
ncbi:MAG: hypothetical protein KBB37_06130 [Bacteroidia bacterium]|nr:hypothetical protein [Bacteroidia bacterium]MBP7260845.1 hypothetical protein [Bacteroidia bacterium]MBP9179058.1 hypothetical protein [Bacteroidia bacterium]MBP9724451.1 hypothetical protein [Bacteroidia bacterium]